MQRCAELAVSAPSASSALRSHNSPASLVCFILSICKTTPNAKRIYEVLASEWLSALDEIRCALCPRENFLHKSERDETEQECGVFAAPFWTKTVVCKDAFAFLSALSFQLRIFVAPEEIRNALAGRRVFSLQCMFISCPTQTKAHGRFYLYFLRVLRNECCFWRREFICGALCHVN